jgi:hypothetical protein
MDCFAALAMTIVAGDEGPHLREATEVPSYRFPKIAEPTRT